MTKRVIDLEFLISFSLNDENTWLLSDEEQHWSFETIKSKLLEYDDFKFDTLHTYCRFNHAEFSKIWHRDNNNVKGEIRIVSGTYEKFKDCTHSECSIVSTQYVERLSIGGFHDSEFESTLSKEWCPPELKGDKAAFFTEMNQALVESGVSHFSCATFIKLLSLSNQRENGLFLAVVTTLTDDEWEKITMSSCSKCNNNNNNNNNNSDHQLESNELFEVCHLCHLLECEPNGVYICRHFEKRFDFTHSDESPIAHINIAMNSGESHYFFYKTTPHRHNNNNGGKDMITLRQEALKDLESFLDERLSKCDRHRPAHSAISASQIRMRLSKIRDPMKKCNNDKEEVQLRNHAKTLTTSGKCWIDNLLKEQYFVVDLMNGNESSFIDRWHIANNIQSKLNYHKILSRSTIVKINQYLIKNQRFKKDKADRQINVTIMPMENESDTWSKGWFVSVNAREFIHQLCSISFRVNSGLNFSQHHRNNLSYNELFKIFDWGIYSEEQSQIITVSISQR